MQEQGKSSTPYSFYSTAISLGLTMASGVLLFTAAGWYIDRKRGGGKAATLCGVFLGLFFGAYEVWKTVREIERRASGQKGADAGK